MDRSHDEEIAGLPHGLLIRLADRIPWGGHHVDRGIHRCEQTRPRPRTDGLCLPEDEGPLREGERADTVRSPVACTWVIGFLKPWRSIFS